MLFHRGRDTHLALLPRQEFLYKASSAACPSRRFDRPRLTRASPWSSATRPLNLGEMYGRDGLGTAQR